MVVWIHEPECVKKYYEGCSTVVDMAKKAATFEGVDFLSIHLEGGDPNGAEQTDRGTDQYR